MAITVNATLNLAINAKSVGPAISSIQKEFQNQKIALQLDIQIPKGIDREVYKVSNAFRTLDDRMRSVSFSTAAGLSHIQAFVNALTGVGQSLTKTISPSAKSLDQAAKAVTNIAKQTKVAKEETVGLAEAVGVSAKRFASFAIAAGFIANVVFQFQKGFDAALQFDRELVRLKQVGGDSQTIITGIADRVTYLSKTLGVSSSELIRSATTLRQAGLSASDTKMALDSLAKTTLAPTFDSIGNTTEGVIAILAQFGQGVGALEGQLGSINRVAADYAVESGDLVEAIKRTGGAFVSAGGNLEELLALFTSVRATTRESADSIATAFRTIFARLQRPETIKNLQDIGIQLQDLEGRFVGPYEAVKRLNQGLSELPTSTGQFAKIVEEIGGVRQISKVIPLIQQFPLAAKAYNSALEGQSSLSRDAALAQESFINKINQLKESFLELFRVIVSNDAFRVLLDSAIAFTKGITDLVAAFKPLVSLFVAFSAIKIGGALVGSATAFRAGFSRRGFASGGVVPVTPNTGIRSGTDTVPALLTEGEYVINRSSAKAIGYDTLDELNAYATGGTVSQYSINKIAGAKPMAVGGFVSPKTANDISSVDNTISQSDTNIYKKYADGGTVQKVKNSEKAAMLALTTRSGDETRPVKIIVPKTKLSKEIQAQIPPETYALAADFTVAGPSRKFENDILRGTFKKYIKQAISSIAQRAFNTKIPKVDDSIYDKVIDRSGQGRMFEAVLQSIGQSKVESNNQAFDFPSGVSGELAEIFPGAAGKIGDAKLADNTGSQIGMVSKMLRSPAFGLGSKLKGTYGSLQERAEKSYNRFLNLNPSLANLTYAERREKLKGLAGIEVVKPSKPTSKLAMGGVAGRSGIRMTGGGMMQTGNRQGKVMGFASGGPVGRSGTGIRMTGGGIKSFGSRFAKGGKVLGFVGGGEVPSPFGDVGGGGYIRPKVVGSSFPTGFNLNKIISDIGLKLSDFVKKIEFKAEEYQVAGRNVAGHFNPKAQSVTSVSGQIPTLLHEVGHAADFQGGSAPKLSEGDNVNSLINSTIKAYISASGQGGLFENQRLIGQGNLSNYKPEKLRREAFADLFAGHAIQTGIKSGTINEKDLPESTRGFLNNPNVKKLLDVFGSGLGQIAGALSQTQSKGSYSVAAAELASSGSGSSVPPKPPVTATGSSPSPDDPQPRKRKIDRLLEEGLQREKSAKTETISEKAIQNVLIDKDAIKARQAEREEIERNAGLSGPLTPGVKDGKVTPRKVNPFAAEEQFGVVQPKFKTGDEYEKAIEEDAKNIAKSKKKAKKVIEDLGADLEVGVVKLEQAGSRVRARVKLDTGEVKVFESQNTYKKPKLAQNRIDKLTDRGFNAKALLAGRGGFNEIDPFNNDDNDPPGRFGKIGNFVKKNSTFIASAALLAAPYVQQKITGTAESPGAFGQTGAKVGAGFTGAIEGAGLGASLGSFTGPIGTVVGGVIGGLGGLITSLQTFSKEIDNIAKDKLAKAFTGLTFDAKTGKSKSDLELSNVSKAFAGIRDIGIVFDQNKFNQEKSIDEKTTGSVVESLRNYDFSSAIFAGLSNIGLGGKNSVVADVFRPETVESRKVNAQQSINEFSEQLQEIIKRGIDANPEKSFESFKKFGPELFQGNKAFQILEKSLDVDAINNLKEYFKQVQNATAIQKKFAAAQSEANKSLTDLGTALDTLNTSLTLAGENYQKDTARSNIKSEALAGKISAGAEAPSLALFGQFGKNLENFAKPGGQLDKFRPEISKAIDIGLSNALPNSAEERSGQEFAKVTGLTKQSDIINATRALTGPESEEKSLASGDLAEKFLSDKISTDNPFAKNLIPIVKNTLLKNFANTEKIPTEDLRSKLTEDVISQFKNVQQQRDSANKQLESAFQSFNQQLGSLAERRSTVLQKGVEFQNRGVEFNLQNKAAEEDVLGSPTRFTPGGPISSREILAQEEIRAREDQKANQLASLGIERGATSGGLGFRLAGAQEDLSAAVAQKEAANKAGDQKGFVEASKRVTDLSFTINNLKKGMDLLANSTSVLEAKNKALSVASDQLKDDLAGRKSDAEILTFGTREEKQKLFQKEQLTQAVTNNPQLLQFLGDEQKQLVRERLNESNIGRTFTKRDDFERERGFGVATSSQVKDFLIQRNFNTLQNNPATAILRQRFDDANLDVKKEQRNLNIAGRQVNNVELQDVAEQRKAIDENFSKYLNGLNEAFNNNAEVFKDFAGAANNLAAVLVTNPIPSEIVLKNDSNVNVNINNANIGNTITNEAKNAIREEIRLAMIQNGVITDRTPSRT